MIKGAKEVYMFGFFTYLVIFILLFLASNLTSVLLETGKEDVKLMILDLFFMFAKWFIGISLLGAFIIGMGSEVTIKQKNKLFSEIIKPNLLDKTSNYDSLSLGDKMVVYEYNKSVNDVRDSNTDWKAGWLISPDQLIGDEMVSSTPVILVTKDSLGVNRMSLDYSSTPTERVGNE
jgi:hypothetical protein